MFDKITSSDWSSLFCKFSPLSFYSKLTWSKCLTNSGLALKWWFGSWRNGRTEGLNGHWLLPRLILSFLLIPIFWSRFTNNWTSSASFTKNPKNRTTRKAKSRSPFPSLSVSFPPILIRIYQPCQFSSPFFGHPFCNFVLLTYHPPHKQTPNLSHQNIDHRDLLVLLFRSRYQQQEMGEPQ